MECSGGSGTWSEMTEVWVNLFPAQISQIVKMSTNSKNGILQNIFIPESVVLTLPYMVTVIRNGHLFLAFIYVHSPLRTALHSDLLILPCRKFNQQGIQLGQRIHLVVNICAMLGTNEISAVQKL